MKIASFYDTNDKLYVDCSECERGGNGSDDDKCSCGARIKQKNKGGCFCGILIPSVKNKLEAKK